MVFLLREELFAKADQHHTPTHPPRLPSGALSGSSCGRSRDEMGWGVENQRRCERN